MPARSAGHQNPPTTYDVQPTTALRRRPRSRPGPRPGPRAFPTRQRTDCELTRLFVLRLKEPSEGVLRVFTRLEQRAHEGLPDTLGLILFECIADRGNGGGIADLAQRPRGFEPHVVVVVAECRDQRRRSAVRVNLTKRPGRGRAHLGLTIPCQRVREGIGAAADVHLAERPRRGFPYLRALVASQRAR